jgi:hypothetical protein
VEKKEDETAALRERVSQGDDEAAHKSAPGGMGKKRVLPTTGASPNPIRALAGRLTGATFSLAI